ALELRPHVRRFRAAHQQFEAAARRVDATRAKRDRALDAVGESDDRLDDSVEVLASSIVGARMNPRGKPFQNFSPYRPPELKRLGYRRGGRRGRKPLKPRNR